MARQHAPANDSIARSLAVVGDYWVGLILRELFAGNRRFDSLYQRVGASTNILADRLRRMEQYGVLRRVPYQQRPTRYQYQLTDAGRDLYPYLMALMKWGDTWLSGDDGPPQILRHTVCGHITPPGERCANCDQKLLPWEVEILPNTQDDQLQQAA